MIAKLTSKGQLTIPKAVREKLSLYTGSHVSFVVIGDRVELTPISTPLCTLKSILPKNGKKLTLEEIEQSHEGRDRVCVSNRPVRTGRLSDRLFLRR